MTPVGASASQAHDDILVAPSPDRGVAVNSGGRKVSGKQLSQLQKFILAHAVNGIERGEIVAEHYGLERRYRGYYADPCFRGKAKHDFNARYRRVQPVVTRSLKRLAERGLVQLVRRGHCVKEIITTVEGRNLLRTISAARPKEMEGSGHGSEESG